MPRGTFWRSVKPCQVQVTGRQVGKLPWKLPSTWLARSAPISFASTQRRGAQGRRPDGRWNGRRVELIGRAERVDLGEAGNLVAGKVVVCEGFGVAANRWWTTELAVAIG